MQVQMVTHTVSRPAIPGEAYIKKPLQDKKSTILLAMIQVLHLRLFAPKTKPTHARRHTAKRQLRVQAAVLTEDRKKFIPIPVLPSPLVDGSSLSSLQFTGQTLWSFAMLLLLCVQKRKSQYCLLQNVRYVDRKHIVIQQS
jgi:hypothetical protein